MLYGRPRPKKNNNFVTKNRLIIPNKGYLQYEKECVKQLKTQYIDKPIESRIFLKIKYYLADRREPDVFNLDNAIGDILQKARVILDDKQVNSVFATKTAIDRQNPRAEITIVTGLNELGEVLYDTKNSGSLHN